MDGSALCLFVLRLVVAALERFGIVTSTRSFFVFLVEVVVVVEAQLLIEAEGVATLSVVSNDDSNVQSSPRSCANCNSKAPLNKIKADWMGFAKREENESCS